MRFTAREVEQLFDSAKQGELVVTSRARLIEPPQLPRFQRRELPEDPVVLTVDLVPVDVGARLPDGSEWGGDLHAYLSHEGFGLTLSGQGPTPVRLCATEFRGWLP